MFEKRFFDKQEIIDDLDFNDPRLVDNLKEMDFLNHWLGYNRMLIRGMGKVHKKYRDVFNKKTVRIADLGCGGGDSLIYIQDWAVKGGMDVELVGIDGNPFVLHHARNVSEAYPQISYQLMNILKDINSLECYDMVILNNVCHHFEDEDLITLIRNLYRRTKFAIIINDIHRYWLAYLGIKWLTKILNFSYLGRHDAPLSVLKGFKKKELNGLLTLSNITSFEIKWGWPFRWQVIIWCK